MTDKTRIPTKLLWVDLEMTGLDASHDVILEIYAEVTDFDFYTVATYEARLAQNRGVVEERMQANSWWQDYPGNRDDFLDNLGEGKALERVEEEMLALLQEQFGDEPAVLAGNSIHMDRGFIKYWMPKLDAKLHYRMLDVSAFKILMQGKYGVVFEKKETHRAADDVYESIAELKHYLDWFTDNTR